jgi:nicotinamidase-related amidase
LTADNCVVALIDHRPQMLFGVSNFDRQGIINNVVALSKAARVFDLPVVLSTVETKSFSGNLWPLIQAVFLKQVPVERTSMNAWDDQNFVAAIEKTGRKKIVLAGLWTKPALRFQPSKRFMTAMKSTWWKTAAAMSANSLTTMR